MFLWKTDELMKYFDKIAINKSGYILAFAFAGIFQNVRFSFNLLNT